MNEKTTQSTLSRETDQRSSEKSTRRVRKKSAFPKWLRKPIIPHGKRKEVERYLKRGNLHTVCEEARCPNRNECFASGTATFLIMGNICSRNCLFCNVKHGVPQPLDPDEPARLSDVVDNMGLSYVVITTVTRDDLDDGGAEHIAKTISMLKRNISGIRVEILAPDFKGNMKSIQTVLSSRPDVFGHNIETVYSLFSKIRSGADYDTSLQVLSYAAQHSGGCLIKSGFMVGLGETEKEVISLMEDLRRSHVTILTIGQYLQPTQKQVEVKKIITPARFERYQTIAEKLGFTHVFSGPFVRSSYRAHEVFKNN
jgi:lipoic acid synthetase